MNLKIEITKQLKEAGFPQNKKYAYTISPLSKNTEPFLLSMNLSKDNNGYANLLASGYEVYACPDLTELLKECDQQIDSLYRISISEYSAKSDKKSKGGWEAISIYESIFEWGETPEEAVARLWLTIRK